MGAFFTIKIEILSFSSGLFYQSFDLSRSDFPLSSVVPASGAYGSASNVRG